MNRFNLQNHVPRNPYRVPEGYFDSLTSRIMQNLPDVAAEGETGCSAGERSIRMVAFSSRLSRWVGWSVAAAACIVGVMFCTHSPLRETQNTPVQTATTTTAYDEKYEQQVLEYAMLDGSDIYAYMSGEM